MVNNSVNKLKRYPLLIAYVKHVLCFVAAGIWYMIYGIWTDSNGFPCELKIYLKIGSTGFRGLKIYID